MSEHNLQPNSKLTNEQQDSLCIHEQEPIGYGYLSIKEFNGKQVVSLMHSSECSECGEFLKVIEQKTI